MPNLNKRKLTKKQLNEWKWGWFFVAPTLIGLIVLNIIPIFQTLYLSLFRSGDFGRGNIFVGFDNYVRLFNDTQVWHAVSNTLVYTAIVVPVSISISIVIAVLLNQKIFAKTTYRTIYFIPMIAAPAAVTMVWKWMYNNHFGLINYALKSVGLPTVDWLHDPNVALISIAIIGIWSIIGYNVVLMLAGLQEIPKDYYEASMIDGAGPIYQLFNVTIPLLSPTLFFISVTTIIQSMQVFDFIYMMIDVSNPAYERTVSLVYLFYNNSFRYGDRGYGSAIVMLLLVIIMIITVFQLKAQKKWVNYR
ncbi:carbohydrate ABC transporter permease [Evansella cellulosilytica]|uniref:Binding-protein-dependent transport systems inner membrane component n=1 Tax=Evansella cellulosilytica (strain ATCC 21833 / DSM 2522 / FERM P-1141 / JCM 9156 / N-4) TaxID=649639 RepID=E6TQZ1_EVAC2|nr:sugar ABC transporter permease [Evansella cellulosilytica]ADU29367.1 binding-protein-dependent transport systems inner membrane component [Evansella cellulosilytica DSM 2522]